MMDLHSPAAWMRVIARNAKRLFVFVVGLTILLAGVAMLALPGPGVLVILVGLFVLASEFAWAERVLDATTSRAAGVATKATEDRRGQVMLAFSGIAMIIAGIVAASVLDGWRLVGVSVALAGLIGIATLHPRVRAWIVEQADHAGDDDDDSDGVVAVAAD